MDDDMQEMSFDEEIEVVNGAEEEGATEQGEATKEFVREKPNHSRKGQKKKNYSIGFKVSCLYYYCYYLWLVNKIIDQQALLDWQALIVRHPKIV